MLIQTNLWGRNSDPGAGFVTGLKSRRKRKSAPRGGTLNVAKMQVLRCERFHTGRETRHFPRRCIFVQNAFCDTTHQLGLRRFKRGSSIIGVSTSNRFFDFAKERADARTTGFVNFGAALGLARAFFSLRRIGQRASPTDLDM